MFEMVDWSMVKPGLVVSKASRPYLLNSVMLIAGGFGYFFNDSWY